LHRLAWRAIVAGMPPPIACVMCLVGPEAQQFAAPLTQAAVIAAPFLLRDRLRRGWRWLSALAARRDRSEDRRHS
jgi:hypothetical protein